MSYDRKIASAQRQIKAKGAIVTWQKLPRNPNSSQPWKVQAITPTNFSVNMLFLNQGLKDALFHLLPKTDVTTGAPDAMIAGGLSFTPELTDVVIKSTGEKYVIAAIDPFAPDGTPILYYLRFE